MFSFDKIVCFHKQKQTIEMNSIIFDLSKIR